MEIGNRCFAIIFMILILVAGAYGCADDDESSVDPILPSGDDDSDDDDSVTDDDDAAPLCESGHEFSFDLTPGQRNVPYPSFLFTQADSTTLTGRRVDVSGQVSVFVDEIFDAMRFVLDPLNALDGFGVSTPIWFPVDTRPDPVFFPDSIAPSLADSVYCAVVEDASHPQHGRVWRMDVSFRKDSNVVELKPRLPLAQDTTYACIVTDKLLTLGLECYQQPDALRALLLGEKSDDEPLSLTGEVLGEFLDQYPVDADRIVGATAFVTQNISHDLVQARAQLEAVAQTTPPVTGDWTQIDFSHPNIDSVWETTFESMDYRHQGVFVRDDQNEPTPNAGMAVPIRLYLPKSGINGHAPPYPVVLYAHGVNDAKDQADSLARTLAGYGFATVSLDFIYHGARLPGYETMPSWLLPVFSSVGMLNIFAPEKFRGNFKQGVLDLIQLKQAVRAFDTLDLLPYETTGDGVPDLETSSIYFAGMSLGSLHGGILAAVEPDIDTFLFNVGAANWITIMYLGKVGRILWAVAEVFDLFTDERLVDLMELFLGLYQAILDGGDPYSYGVHVLDEPLYDLPDRQINILHQMAASDETLGGPGCGQLARTIGLPQIRPFTWQVRDLELVDAPIMGQGMFQYNTGDHSMMLRPNEFFDAVHLQAGTFFRTAYDNGVATIINPL